MVYNPTRKRSVGVRPVGSVSMDGLRQIGASFENLGNAAVGISDTIEKSQLEEALLDGASRGASHAVSYETTENGEKVLKPFVSGSIDDLIGNLRPSSARAVREAYDKAAKSTYLSALTMDAQQQAQNAFIENEFSPEKILEKQTKYIENLRDKADNDDVINMALPNILAHWTGARNKSLFSVRSAAQQQSKAVHEQRLQQIANEHAAVITSGSNLDTISGKVESLNKERQTIYESLSVLTGLDEKGAELLSTAHNTAVQSTVTKTEVSRLFRKEGAEATISMIMDLEKNIATDPNVNGDEIIKSAYDQLRDEEKLLTEQVLIKNKKIDAIKHQVAYQILQGKIINEQQIYDAGLKPGSAEANTAIHQLRNEQNMVLNRTERDEAVARENINKEFDDLMLFYKYPDQIPENSNFTRATIWYDMVDGFTSGKFGSDKLVRFIDMQQKIMFDEIKSSNNLKMINIQRNMSPSSKYVLPPSVFENLTDQLMQEGIIGDVDGAVMTNTAWESRVNAYRNGFAKAQADRNIVNGLQSKIDQGIPFDPTDRKNAKKTGFEPTFLANGKVLNVFDQDPTTAEASMDLAVAYTVATGSLHSQIEPFMVGAKWLSDENDFAKAMSVHNQIANTFLLKGKSEAYIQNVFENAGVDVSLLNSDTRNYSMDQIRYMQENKGRGASRRLSEIFPNRGNENEIRQYYFREAMEGNFVEGLLNDFSPIYRKTSLSVANAANLPANERPEHTKMIEMMEANGQSIEGAILDDPRLSKLIFEGAEIDMARGRYTSDEKGYMLAIKSNMTRLMSVFGLEENDDGNAEFVFHPVVREAQKSANEFPNVIITKEDINQNITDVIRATPMVTSEDGMVQNTIMEAMDNGEYKLVPNKIYGKDITYSVYTQTPDGENILLLPNYRYDFKKSAQYQAWNDAINEIENNALKNMMITLPLLNDTVMSATYNAVNNYNRSEETFAELKKAYNRAGYTIFGFDNFNPAEIGKDDKARMLSLLLTLGVR